MRKMEGLASSRYAFQCPSRYPSSVCAFVISIDTNLTQLYSTETSLRADVSPYRLSLSYPAGNSSSIFTLMVSTFRSKTTISGWEDLVGISASVTTNMDAKYSLSFAGAKGGQDDAINDFEFWNFTYIASEDFEGVPELVLEFEY
jgi:hypothetical protein